MLINRELILIKIESVYNTDSVPVAATDAFYVEGAAWSHDGARMLERPAIRGGSTGQLQQLWADTMFQISFSMEMVGGGAAYSASIRPTVDLPLRATGHSSTLDPGVGTESYKYSPVSDWKTHESVSIYYYSDDILYISTGIRGNVEFSFEAGGRPMANFTFKGHTATPTDVVLPTGTFSTVKPPIVKNAAFTIDTYAAAISKLTFSPNWEMPAPSDLSAVDGFGEVTLTKRDIGGSFDPEQVLIATHPFVDRWRSGKSMVLASGDIGAVQYEKVSIDAPAVAYREVGPSDKEGIRTYEMGFGMHESAGDDEYTITFD